MPSPIIVMSFNRPQFLAPVLASVKAQQPRGLDGREVHLFQDGAVNRYSRLRYAKDDDITACLEIFSREFPEGVVHVSKDNIGVCENFRRAEEYVFADRGFECAWFFEDDLLLSPGYFQMMEQLQNFAESVNNVAYFAAYGNHYASSGEIALGRRELMTLDHQWGFGLLRRNWRELQRCLEPFYDAVVGTDYSRRDHRKIFDIYKNGDRSPRASSQDAAKAIACDQMGFWRCNTVVPYAQYIGTMGQHMTPAKFKELGFENTVVAIEPVLDLEWPGPSGIRERVLEQRTLFNWVWRDELDQIMADLPARKFNPMRLCTNADIEAAYYLLLRRKVEARSIFDEHAGKSPVQVLVSSIIKSEEFRDLTYPGSEVFTFRDARSRGYCSGTDIHNLYTLLFHREPERDKVAEYQGKTHLDLVVEGMFRSSEFRSLNEQFEI